MDDLYENRADAVGTGCSNSGTLPCFRNANVHTDKSAQPATQILLTFNCGCRFLQEIPEFLNTNNGHNAEQQMTHTSCKLDCT